MRQTFITTMPDHVGAFLQASRAMAQLGLNITRVSYNRAIDVHTLFIEAEGEEDALARAVERLEEIGYLRGQPEAAVLLVAFRLRDVPGAVTAALELIQQYDFNISYLSSQADGSGFQEFKMGLVVDDRRRFADFLNAAARLCPVRVIDYDKTEKILDNSVFYVSFASELAQRMGLGRDSRTELLVNINRAMQLLDERSEPFHKAFECIRGFADALARNRGENFHPRITGHQFGGDLRLFCIEPPCGSNTCLLLHRGLLLAVDTGYACYRQEMLPILEELVPDFHRVPRAAVITHADVDHCGLLDLFPTVYMSGRGRRSLVMERTEEGGFRERNPLHAPYSRICKALTSYRSPDLDTVQVIGDEPEKVVEPLQRTGSWSFGDLDFELYEGAGGHLPGELVLVERRRRLVFTGDIFINIKELTPEQAAYNKFAPYLMTSVDTDPVLCAAERRAIPEILGPGTWHIFGGHGPEKVLEVE